MCPGGGIVREVRTIVSVIGATAIAVSVVNKADVSVVLGVRAAHPHVIGPHSVPHLSNNACPIVIVVLGANPGLEGITVRGLQGIRPWNLDVGVDSIEKEGSKTGVPLDVVDCSMVVVTAEVMGD